MAIPPSEIREYARGDLELRHEDLNAYRANAQKQITVDAGHVSDVGIYQNTQIYVDPEPIIVVPEEDYPPFSVFGVRSGLGNDLLDPLPMAAARLGSLSNTGDGSLLTAYTNGQISIDANKQGYAYPIVPGRRYFCSLVGLAPKIGYPCGIDSNTLSVRDDNSGFVCYSAQDTKLGVTGIWVTLAQVGGLIGKVEQDLTGYDTINDILGQGIVRVQLDAGGLIDAADPNGVSSFFDLDPVYNISPQVIRKDTIVALHSYSAVGMVAIPVGMQVGFIGWVILEIPAGTPTVDPGGTAGFTASPNIRLQRLDNTITFVDILDSDGLPVEIIAYNHCGVPVVIDQRIQGKYINGLPYIDVVCCPP